MSGYQLARFFSLACLGLAGASPAAVASADDPLGPSSAPNLTSNSGAAVEDPPAGSAEVPAEGSVHGPVEPLGPAPRFAGNTSADSPVSRRVDRRTSLQERQGVGGDVWLRGLVPLVVVLSLIGLGAWLVRKCFPVVRLSAGGAVHVVARSVVGPRHSVALLQLGRRLVLVGLTGERMTRICEISDAEEVLELLAQTNSAGGGRSGFDDLLSRESASFREEAAERADAEAAAGGAYATAAPVTRLLTRLRALQRI